jgi:hypothetical protein
VRQASADSEPEYLPVGSVEPLDRGDHGGSLGPAQRDVLRAGREARQGREERVIAYLLCSIAGDLKIHEVVDAGVWNVGFTMPLFGGTL